MVAHYIHLGSGFSAHGHTISIENAPTKGQILTADSPSTASWQHPVNSASHPKGDLLKQQAEVNFPTTDGSNQTTGVFLDIAEMGDGLIINYDFNLCPSYLIMGYWIDAPGHISISFVDLGKTNHPINLPVIITLIKSTI